MDICHLFCHCSRIYDNLFVFQLLHLVLLLRIRNLHPLPSRLLPLSIQFAHVIIQLHSLGRLPVTLVLLEPHLKLIRKLGLGDLVGGVIRLDNHLADKPGNVVL